jgi:sugar (pentulose or hexulose) kinase
MPNSSKTYLAFDLGAESGRALLGHVSSGILSIEEIHRFPNEAVESINFPDRGRAFRSCFLSFSCHDTIV